MEDKKKKHQDDIPKTNDKKSKSEEPKKKKSVLREWVDAIVFAFIAAAILRTFLFGSYKIPTPSMEKDLLVGDFLIVSNITYGPRTPMGVCMPFFQVCVPGIKLPWFRIPGYRDVERNDIIVFNVPFEVKPISQKTNYIKRAAAIAGDTLSIKDKIVYINGVPEEKHDGIQRFYVVKMNEGVRLSDAKMEATGGEIIQYMGDSTYLVNMTEHVANTVKAWSEVDSLNYYVIPEGQVEPGYVQSEGIFSKAFLNHDQLPEIVVPFKGQKIELSSQNWYIYKDLIERYEKNDVKRAGDKFTINGVETNTYTVKQNYYFAMGDNRDNSLDSRFWGFVPKDHIIGKAAIVWMSLDGAIPRFERIFHIID